MTNDEHASKKGVSVATSHGKKGPTVVDLMSAVSFLAADSDKTGTLTIDKIVDMNAILGVTDTLAFQDSGSALHLRRLLRLLV